MTSVEFCEKLLEKEGVVTAPGSAFGEQGEGYVRLSYATSMEQINRGDGPDPAVYGKYYVNIQVNA